MGARSAAGGDVGAPPRAPPPVPEAAGLNVPAGRPTPDDEPGRPDGVASRGVAAFDFDGTLTRRDSLGPFLRSLVGPTRLAAALAADAHRIGLAVAGLGSRDRAKERLLGRLLVGLEHDAVATRGREYGTDLARDVRAAMRDRLAWHRDQGHAVVIVSASLDVYLDEVGRVLGADAVLASRLEVRDGRLTGRLLDGNCRGPEKARRLRAWLGGRTGPLWAYGDSRGDDEMLAIADHPLRVGRRTGRLVPRG